MLEYVFEFELHVFHRITFAARDYIIELNDWYIAVLPRVPYRLLLLISGVSR